MAASVSVILPAFNERDNVLALIDEIHTHLKIVPHHIVLIDDQSTDGTAGAVAALGDPRVCILETSQRLGLGRSIRLGIDRSAGDYIIVMDSDFNHQPAYLPFMISAMDIYDGAFASRFSPGGGMTSLWRQFLSRSFNVFVQWKLDSPVKDHLYGFFIIRREVLMRLPFDDIFWGYGDYCMRLMYFLWGQSDRILQFPAVNGERRYGAGNPRLGRTFIEYASAVMKFSGQVRARSNT